MKILAFALALSFLNAPVPSQAETNPKLPDPYATPSIRKESKVIGWPEGKMPVAAEGFQVTLFASLDSPRNMILTRSGDVLVAQAKKKPGEESPNQITRLHLKGSELQRTSVFARGLNLPFGMALSRNEFFVAEPTRILKFTLKNGRIQGAGTQIAELPFPQPQRHWTRHLLLNSAGTKLYVSIGSASNVGEAPDPLDPRTASVMEMNRDGSDAKIVAGGLRNPVALAWEPTKRILWAVVNERDELGDDLVPDYIASVKRGGFYGWPYAYWGKNVDPRMEGKRADLVSRSLTPDYSLGAHTASLGIAFTANKSLPPGFDQGALIAQHGSWNRSSFSGYKVTYVPFVNGKPQNGEKDFLTGFIASEEEGTVYGRPVSSLILRDGSVLVSDDGAGKIWKVSRVP
jgi:glucose/arabinose dehydrogenase